MHNFILIATSVTRFCPLTGCLRKFLVHTS